MAFLAPIAAAVGSWAGSAAGIATIASTAFTGLTAIQSGNYQAAVARNNAEIAKSNAQAENLAAQQEQIRSDHEYAAALGEQLSAAGVSGVDLLSRTMLQGRQVTETTGRQAAFDIRQKGDAAAQRFQQDAANFEGQARAAKRQGAVTAFGSLLKAGVDATDTTFGSSLATRRTRRTSSYAG